MPSTQTRSRRSKSTKKVTVHQGFGERMTTAADNNPNFPPKGFGRLGYLTEEMEKRGIKVTIETARKWFSGETIPTQEKLILLAQVLGVDIIWLTMGEVAYREATTRRQRSEEADLMTNIVFDLLSVAGARVRFPEDDDTKARTDGIDLYAVIKGASYSFHIVGGEFVGRDTARFQVRDAGDDVITLGIVPDEEFKFHIFDVSNLTSDETVADGDGERWTKAIKMDTLESQRIRSFVQRI